MLAVLLLALAVLFSCKKNLWPFHFLQQACDEGEDQWLGVEDKVCPRCTLKKETKPSTDAFCLFWTPLKPQLQNKHELGPSSKRWVLYIVQLFLSQYWYHKLSVLIPLIAQGISSNYIWKNEKKRRVFISNDKEAPSVVSWPTNSWWPHWTEHSYFSLPLIRILSALSETDFCPDY